MAGGTRDIVESTNAPASDERWRATQELFAGPGEVRALARTLDWGATTLGWPDEWSPALRIATRAMLDAPFPICLWSGPSYALVYNDAYRRILAAKHPAALGQPGAIVWAEIWTQIASQFEQVRSGGPPIYFENARFEMARLEGGGTENAWFDYSLSALRDEAGAVVAILNICPETTPRVRAERELDVERARLQQVFRRAPSFIVAFRGPEMVYEFVNEAYYQLVGHRDILGKPLLVAIPEIRDQGFDTILRRVLETGEPWVGRETPVLLQRTPDAPLETRYLDMVFQPLVESDGTHSGVVAHGSDITEQVLARREVERARDRADRMQRLTAALAATNTLDAVADVVAEQVTAVGTSKAMLELREPAEGEGEEDHLVILRETGITTELFAPYTRYPLSMPTPTATSVRSRAPLFVEDGTALRERFPSITRLWDVLDTHALVSIPLTVGDEAVGGISFSFASPREFSDEERSYFLALGRQVAQALERVRLGEAERTARDRAEALQRVTAALARARTLHDVGRVFSHELTTLVGADTAWVGVVSPAGDTVEALGWSGYPDSVVDQWRAIPLDAPLALARAVRSRRPQWWATRDELVTAYPARAGVIRSIDQEGVAVLPLLPAGEGTRDDGTETRPLGGIVVGYLTPQRFDAGRRSFFLALAQQCGLAIERARAYEAEQSARVEAESARRIAEGASRAKSEFLAVMSHELRTPLNAIGGYAELMEMGLRGTITVEQRADLERIQRAQRHLLGLINGVLNYVKVDAGAVHYDVADVVVDEVLATCEALVAPQTAAKRLALYRAPCDRSVTVRADREKVQQVVLNLLSNAVKFTDAGGRISLDCTVAAETVAVRVADTGRGIAPDHLERVFQPFVQVDATLTRTNEGTGLGLAISRDLARGMGGDLTVESTLGEGSTFTLTLPRGAVNQ
jgi:signal transduction histidine kinase/PAS domain-containing protein